MTEKIEHPGYSVYFDYRVDIGRRRNRMTATLDGVELAVSERTLLVDEQDHGLVIYFPKADVNFDLLKPVEGYHTRCPWKGEASYWSLAEGGDPIVWTYEEPFPQVAQIRDHVAFYQNIVTVAIGTAPYLPRWDASLKTRRIEGVVMEVLERVADASLVEAGLISCQANVRVMDGKVLLAQSAGAFTTAWPEANGSLLVPEADVRMDRLSSAGTDEHGAELFSAEGSEAIAWRDQRKSPSGEGLIGFKRRPLTILMADLRPGSENGVSTIDRFPRWGDMTDLVRLMDVMPQPDGSFEAPTYGDVRRNVVEGGQLLGDTIVAASKTDPSKRVISAQTIFSRPGVFDKPLRLDVNKSRMGRSFTTLTVETTQGGKPIATGAVLMEAGADDLIRHHAEFPDVPGPDEAQPYDFGLIGRELRIVNGDYSPDPDRIGPPEIHAWMRHRQQPEEDYLRQAILAQPTTHWTIGAAMLPHKGYGEVMAHRSISTGVLSSTIYFHEDPDLTDWLLYSTRATYAGRGLAQGEGRIFSRNGQLIATYSVQVMVRAFDSSDAQTGMKDDRLM